MIIRALTNRFREINRVNKGGNADSKVAIVRKLDSDSYKVSKKIKLSQEQSMNNKFQVIVYACRSV